MREVVLLHFIGHRWTRTDQAHVTKQYVVELRKLIQRILAKPAPDRSDSRVIRYLEQNAVALVHMFELCFQYIGVLNHSTELVAAKSPALSANPLSSIEDRSMGSHPNRKSDSQHQRSQNNKREDRYGDIDRTLQ